VINVILAEYYFGFILLSIMKGGNLYMLPLYFLKSITQLFFWMYLDPVSILGKFHSIQPKELGEVMVTKKSISQIYSMLLIVLTLIGSAAFPTLVRAAGILYVTPDGTGDCSSWVNACILQTALTNATGGDDIWVAAGTYKPTTSTSPFMSFVLKNGVAVYGGFDGTESLVTQRDPEINITILSGDIGVEGDNSDNSERVIIASNVDNTTILDGFTITGGQVG
jgi:hypothetical protein